MSAEIFLKISGVNGEAHAKGHEKEIEISSFSMGAHNPSSVSTGMGSGAGKVEISSITLTKTVDLSSAILFQKCCEGKHFDEATLTVRKSGGDSPVEYWTMKMKQVFVDNVNWDGTKGGDTVSEHFSLSFAECKFTYWSQNEKGAKDQKMEAGWNVKQNAAAA